MRARKNCARVTESDGKLRVSMGGNTGTLVPDNANRFQVPAAGGEVEFETGADGVPRRLLLQLPGQQRMTFDVVPPADATQLTQFIGNYYSDEIDSTYKITLKDDKLVLDAQEK